jgi:hypothetical protein
MDNMDNIDKNKYINISYYIQYIYSIYIYLIYQFYLKLKTE